MRAAKQACPEDEGRFFDDLRTFRVKAGLTVSALARGCGLDRGTVTRAEKHQPLRPEHNMRIINFLNETHYSKNGHPIDPAAVLSNVSRYGHR